MQATRHQSIWQFGKRIRKHRYDGAFTEMPSAKTRNPSCGFLMLLTSDSHGQFQATNFLSLKFEQGFR